MNQRTPAETPRRIGASRFVFLFAALVLGVSFAVGTEDEEVKAARAAVVDLAAAIEKGKDAEVIREKIGLIRKKHELADLMKIHKPREEGGIGYGGMGQKANGLENKLHSFTQGNGPSAAALKREAAQMLQLAHINLAMAEVVKPSFNKPMKGKGRKDWEKYADDQKAGAEDMIQAIKSHNGPGVKAAAETILNSCSYCHKLWLVRE